MEDSDQGSEENLPRSKIVELDHSYALLDASRVKEMSSGHLNSLNNLTVRLQRGQQVNSCLKKTVESLSSVLNVKEAHVRHEKHVGARPKAQLTLLFCCF